MNQPSAKRLTIILGVVMIVAMGGSVILPLLTPNRSNVPPTPQPTTIPTATLLPPITDFSGISFEREILHPSGLFSMAQPTGWEPLAPLTSQPGQAAAPELNLNNGQLLSVIQGVVQPAEGIQTLDDVDSYFTPDLLRQTWTAYSTWRETGRQRDGDRLILDFELENRRNQVLIARQEAWTDGQYFYRLRVVTPENQVELLKYLIEQMRGTLKVVEAYAGTPSDWLAYFDPASKVAVRFPNTWRLTDGAPGRPASLSGDNGALLRLDVQTGAAADEAAARQWLETARPGAAVLSVNEIARGDKTGFALAYGLTNADGDRLSGLALLLNADEQLYTADLRFPAADVDLNSAEGREAYADLAAVMDTFTILAGLNVPLSSPTPIPAG